MYEDLIAQLEKFSGPKFTKIRELLKTKRELRGRQNPDLQLSASALVFRGQELFFIEHPYQKELLLPAGHVELGESPLTTAVREFHEETGYFAHGGPLVDVNLIEIPFNLTKNEAAHQHIDFRYLLTLSSAPPTAAELPLFTLKQAAAPAEFKSYYLYQNQKEVNHAN